MSNFYHESWNDNTQIPKESSVIMDNNMIHIIIFILATLSVLFLVYKSFDWESKRDIMRGKKVEWDSSQFKGIKDAFNDTYS